MIFLFFWVVFSIVAAGIANNKNRNAYGVFFLSLVLSPLIGIIVALVMKSGDEIAKDRAKRGEPSAEYRKCPFCAEAVRTEAVKCKHCGSALEPAPLPQPQVVAVPQPVIRPKAAPTTPAIKATPPKVNTWRFGAVANNLPLLGFIALVGLIVLTLVAALVLMLARH